MQELRPTAEWSELSIPQFVILKIQNTSISTEAKLQVYLGMDRPSNNTYGFYLTPGSSFDTMVGKNKVFIRSNSGATGGFAYADITNKLTPTTFETEHLIADISNSFTKYIQRAHTIVVQNISNKDITLAISDDTSMRDGFVIKPYQFIGMNIALNSNISLYGDSAKASLFVTPSFDANGGINSEMMSVFEKYFGIIEIINTDYTPKAQHKKDLEALSNALTSELIKGLNEKLDKKTFNEFLQANTETLNGVVPLSKPTQFGPGVTGSPNFRDEKFRVELMSNDPVIKLDPINGLCLNKVTSYTASDNNNYIVTVAGLKGYLNTLNSKYVAINGGTLQSPLSSNIIAGDNIAGTISVADADSINKSGFYITNYTINSVRQQGSVFHIEDHLNSNCATQLAISGVDKSASIRLKKSGTWGTWGTLLPSSEFNGSIYFPKTGGDVTGASTFKAGLNIENSNANIKNNALLVTVPDKGSSFTEVNGIKVVSSKASTSAISIDVNSVDSNGLKSKVNGTNAVGIITESSAKGISVSSGTIGVEIKPTNSNGHTAVKVDATDKTNIIGVHADISSNSTGLKISKKSGASNTVGITNDSVTVLKDKLIYGVDYGAVKSINANIISVKNGINSTGLMIGETVGDVSRTEDTLFKLVKRNSNSALSIDASGVNTFASEINITDGCKGLLINGDPSSDTALRIEQGSSRPAISIEAGTIAIEATGDIRTNGRLVAESFTGALIGTDTYNFDVPDNRAKSMISIAVEDDDSCPGKPIAGEGVALHIGGATDLDYGQIVLMSNRMFIKNVDYTFEEVWTTKDLSKDKVAGIRDITNGSFSVQISNTEDIVTAKNLRCRNLISVENVTGYYSDMRLKKDVRVLHGSLDKVDKINPVSYKPNSKALEAGVEDRNRLGFIAQNVQEVIPEAVERAPINDILGTDDYLTVDNNTLIPVMLGAIKELHLEIKNLKDELSKRGECKCCHQVEK